MLLVFRNVLGKLVLILERMLYCQVCYMDIYAFMMHDMRNIYILYMCSMMLGNLSCYAPYITIHYSDAHYSLYTIFITYYTLPIYLIYLRYYIHLLYTHIIYTYLIHISYISYIPIIYTTSLYYRRVLRSALLKRRLRYLYSNKE